MWIIEQKHNENQIVIKPLIVLLMQSNDFKSEPALCLLVFLPYNTFFCEIRPILNI